MGRPSPASARRRLRAGGRRGAAIATVSAVACGLAGVAVELEGALVVDRQAVDVDRVVGRARPVERALDQRVDRARRRRTWRPSSTSRPWRARHRRPAGRTARTGAVIGLPAGGVERDAERCRRRADHSIAAGPSGRGGPAALQLRRGRRPWPRGVPAGRRAAGPTLPLPATRTPCRRRIEPSSALRPPRWRAGGIASRNRPGRQRVSNPPRAWRERGLAGC